MNRILSAFVTIILMFVSSAQAQEEKGTSPDPAMTSVAGRAEFFDHGFLVDGDYLLYPGIGYEAYLFRHLIGVRGVFGTSPGFELGDVSNDGLRKEFTVMVAPFAHRGKDRVYVFYEWKQFSASKLTVDQERFRYINLPISSPYSYRSKIIGIGTILESWKIKGKQASAFAEAGLSRAQGFVIQVDPDTDTLIDKPLSGYDLFVKLGISFRRAPKGHPQKE